MTTTPIDRRAAGRPSPTARAQGAVDTAEQAAESAWVKRAARLGFAGRGVVYVVIGALALQVATGDNQGRQANKQGALQAIAEKPFGEALLVVLAIGLAGYALWRFSEAVWGKRDEQDEKKRTMKRLSSAAKGVLYGAFCFTTISFLRGGGGGGGEQQQKSWTAKVLGWPSGQLLVGAVGAAIIVGGGYLVFRGVTGKFHKQLDEGRMGATQRRLTSVLGTVGISARGVIFALAGLLLIKAAVDFNPDEARGIDGTLRTVAGQPYGQLLLVVAAVGLVLFGLYSFVEARYRKL